MSASYPNGSVAMNSSMETTIREPMEVVGIPEDVWRMENMGISGGHVNAYAWCMNILNFPSHEEVALKFMQDTGIKPRVSFQEALVELHGEELAPLFQVPAGFEAVTE